MESSWWYGQGITSASVFATTSISFKLGRRSVAGIFFFSNEDIFREQGNQMKFQTILYHLSIYKIWSKFVSCRQRICKAGKGVMSRRHYFSLCHHPAWRAPSPFVVVQDWKDIGRCTLAYALRECLFTRVFYPIIQRVDRREEANLSRRPRISSSLRRKETCFSKGSPPPRSCDNEHSQDNVPLLDCACTSTASWCAFISKRTRKWQAKRELS